MYHRDSLLLNPVTPRKSALSVSRRGLLSGGPQTNSGNLFPVWVPGIAVGLSAYEISISSGLVNDDHCSG